MDRDKIEVREIELTPEQRARAFERAAENIKNLVQWRDPQPRTYKFKIINGLSRRDWRRWREDDTVTVTVGSGNPGGEEGSFAEYIGESLLMWYDADKVEVVGIE